MDFYIFTLKAAFDSNWFTAWVYGIPFLVFAFIFVCTIFIFISLIFEFHQTAYQNRISVAMCFLLLIPQPVILYLVAPSMEDITLKREFYVPVASSLYNKTINAAEINPYYSYNILKYEPDFFDSFKKSMIKQAGPKVEVYTNRVVAVMEPIFIKCLTEKKNIFLRTPKLFTIDQVQDQIEDDSNTCAKSSALKLMNERLFKP